MYKARPSTCTRSCLVHCVFYEFKIYLMNSATYMSIRQNIFIEGEYYHIYNRGNSKKILFHDNQDHQHFIKLLTILNTNSSIRLKRIRVQSQNDDPLVSIGAYCLMPNHFHVLITQESEKGVSKFMQKVSTGYAMYYNKKYKHTGGLFEGKFKSKHANNNVYLHYLFAYIHLNPAKILDQNWKLKVRTSPKEMVAYLMNYEYSSFNEYLSGMFVVVNKNAFPDYFPNKQSFIKSVTSWFREFPL